ncbi:MAG: hypothetical protein ACXVCO_15010, partial [Ktedonobacterales bacterium]
CASRTDRRFAASEIAYGRGDALAGMGGMVKDEKHETDDMMASPSLRCDSMRVAACLYPVHNSCPWVL